MHAIPFPFFGELDAEGFWEGYAETSQTRFLSETGFVQRRLIYQLLWCLEYARDTPEHLADTRRVCAQLGLEC